MKFGVELCLAISDAEFDPVALAVILSTAPRIFFIGNGGSAAIASHMAADFAKNGNIPTMAFNDAAALTCLSNDIGFHHVFAFPLRQHLTENDTVIAISSSGQSQNILGAAYVAQAKGANLITFTGFDEDNALRKLGQINVHIASHDYGIVETAHLGLLHATLREIVNAR